MNLIRPLRVTGLITDGLRETLLPKTQQAMSRDETVQTAVAVRENLVWKPGGGLVGMAAFPATAALVLAASVLDDRISAAAPSMPGWLRAGVGVGLVSAAPPGGPNGGH